jgi:hypothetical protein
MKRDLSSVLKFQGGGSMKTSELIGPALDWAVTVANGMFPSEYFYDAHLCGRLNWSTDLAQGGPIIEREKIATAPHGESEWLAYRQGVSGYIVGPTSLIAVMRCFASKLGDEVDVPEELL